MAETYKGVDQMGSSASGKSAKPGDIGSMAQSVADQALSTGREIKDKVIDLAGSSAETLKGQASDFAGAAKDFASQTGDKLKQAANEQRGAGAEYVVNLADTMRRAAREFEPDIPIAATYIRKAASQVESVSDTVRNGNFGDLARSAQAFARRQPTAFLGLSVLAGFGVIRFLKSSSVAGDEHSGQRQNRGPSGHGSTSGSDNGGYRDEFTR